MTAVRLVLRATAAALVLTVPSPVRAQTPVPGWVAIGPAANSTLVLESDPAQPWKMLAGTYFGGLYGSGDYGHSWNHLSNAFSSRSVFAIAYDPTIVGTIYVGTFEGGVFASVDGGLSWTVRNEGLSDTSVQAIAVAPSDPRLVIAATSGGGVYRTMDQGRHWTRADDGNLGIRGQTIVFDPTRAGSVYLGTDGQGVFHSTDGGATWAPFNEGLPPATVLSLTVDRPTGSSLYAGTTDGVYKLTLGTRIWRNITRNLQIPTFNDVLPHPVFAGVTLAATNWGVFVVANDEAGEWVLWTDRPASALASDPTGTVMHVVQPHAGLWATTDFARSWVRADRGMQNVFVGALATVSVGSQPVLFAGTDFGIHHTSPAGWLEVLEPAQTVFDIQVHPTDPRLMFAGTEFGGVWKSEDAGQTWRGSDTGIVPRTIRAVAESALGTTVLAATSSGVYVSRDGGGTWQRTGTGGLTIAQSAVADPTRDPIAFVGGSGGQVYRTGDGGRNFAPASNGLPPESIVGLEIAAWSTVYAVTEGGSLYSSWDDGASWQRIAAEVAHPIRAVRIDPYSPWILYAATGGGGVWKSESAGIAWAPHTAGLNPAYVFALAVDPRNPRVAFAGTLGQVYRSTDGAVTWIATGSLPEGAVMSVVVDPAISGTVYAAVAGAGVYRSEDDGGSWVAVNEGLPASAGAVTVAASVRTPGRLYAGSELRGVFSSADRGSHWASSSKGMSLLVRGLAVDPAAPATIYAGALGGGVFRSADTGESWTNVGLHDGQILQLAIDPVSPRNVYAATSQGLGASRDGGATWTTLGQKAPFVHVLVVDPSDARIAYAGASGTSLLKTTDGGETWMNANTGLPPGSVLALTLGSDGTLYASPERSGVYASHDRGTTWARIPDGALAGQQVLSLASAGDALYAATAGGGAFISAGGASWVGSSNGLATPRLSHVAVNPANRAELWVSTFDATVFKSSDGGSSWTWVGYGLTTSLVRSVTPDPSVPGRLFAATPDGVFVSLDGGALWRASGSGLAGIDVNAVTIAAGVLFAATNGKGVYSSVDGGATWTPSNHGLTNLDVRVVGAGTGAVYAATAGGGVARSSDGGLSWFGATHAQLVDTFMLAVAVDPVTPSTIYAGTSGSGVLKSVNTGIDWSAVNNGLDHLSVLALAIDPEVPSTLYAGTSGGGVFATLDGGASWAPMNEGLFNKVVTALEIDSTDRRRLYAGTEGGGAFAVAVTQAPSLPGCAYVVTPGSAELPAEGGSIQVVVATTPDCRWSAMGHAQWLSIGSTAAGTGPGALDVAVGPNLTQNGRSGLVTVAGHPVIVVQRGLRLTHRLTVRPAGRGQGLVRSDWPGIYCGEDCIELFSDALPVVLTPAPSAGSTFSGWSGDPDCADGQVTMSGDRSCIARFDVEGDADGDGLPDAWEDAFGLDPASAVGPDGADGDPDADGAMNIEEFLAGSHPRGLFVRYFAQGGTTDGTDTTFALAHLDAGPVRVLLRFARPDGGWSTQFARLDGPRRHTIRARDVPGLDNTTFGTVIESDRPVVADRTISWNATADASHAETASLAHTQWYLIAGAAPRRAGATLVYHLFNPGPLPVAVTATHTLPANGSTIVTVHQLAAGALLATRVGDDDARLRGVDFWTSLSAPSAIVAEEVLVEDAGGLEAGSASGTGAIPAPSLQWYFAEGSTESVFETDLLLVNPAPAPASVQLAYFMDDGTVIDADHVVPAMGRLVIDVGSQDPRLADGEFAASVVSTNGVPLLARRATRWPDTGAGGWLESHATTGSPVTGTSWAMAEGETANTNWTMTVVLVANTSAWAGTARVRLLLEDGSTLERTVSLPARSRVTVPLLAAFPTAVFMRFGIVVDSLGPSPAQIVVERSMYSNASGLPWAAGTSAVATRLVPSP